MKPNGQFLLLLAVVALASVFLTRQCSRPPDALTVAIDTLAIRLDAADSVTASVLPRVRAAEEKASRFAQDADSLRLVAARLYRWARSRASSSASPEVGQRSDTVPPNQSLPTGLVQAFDTLLAAYDACTRADQSCQAVVQAKDSIIAADRQYITALERVRDAGRVVVNTKPGRRFLGCALGPAALVGLDGQVSVGAGVSCGVRF